MRLLGTLLIVAVALITFGCQSTPSPEDQPIYSAATPGPWQDVKVATTFDGHRMTITVAGFPTTPHNYVRSFTIMNQSGFHVGRRVFDATDIPTETFILDPESKEVTVRVVSTEQGIWRTEMLPVPAAPAEHPAQPGIQLPVPPQ